jgi:hypothetical protein
MQPTRFAGLTPAQLAVFVWAIVGTVLILIQALIKLWPMASGAIEVGLQPIHWVALPIWVGFMAFTEGYKGFFQRFSPRAAVRADWLARHPTPILVIFAPLMAMGLIYSNRRRLIGSWMLLLGIVTIITIVRQFPQPWRGVVDAGVLVGLSIGTLSTLWFGIRTLAGRPPAIKADLPTRP